MLSHSNIDAIYFSFAKAFDNVNHGMIRHILHDLNIIEKLGEWIYDASKDKLQKVYSGSHW